MLDETFSKTWVDSIIIWVRPYSEVRDSICNPSDYDSSYPPTSPTSLNVKIRKNTS